MIRLKRGVERASCDFCHRRKIRCDKASRARQGHDSCSQCSLRMVECHLDDSNDVRLRRRRHGNVQGDAQIEGVGDAGRESDDTGIGQTDIETPVYSLADRTSQESQQSPAPLPAQASTLVVPTQDAEAATTLSLDHPDPPFLDPSFELSSESLAFLDQIFIQDAEPESWGTIHPTTLGPTDAMDATDHQAEIIAQSQSGETLQLEQPPWAACHLDQASFTAALHAYFDLAALALPIIFEDAFWQDYHAGRCAISLVYAIACRGIPFITIADKWTVQQRVAHQFREAFFKAQHELSDKQCIRLDHLEALALMMDFEYHGVHGSLLHSHLEALFLTHDSLVLLTLQNHVQEGDGSDPSTKLARSSERRSLLFWHVYGLDAFRSLDRKCLSRIQDEVEFNTSLADHTAKSYLDAILRLSFIARRMVQAMCNATVKQGGIDPKVLISVLGQLDNWRNNLCPAHLRRQFDGGAQLESEATGNSANNQLLLHRAIIWLLEVNCYMQIEDYVAQYGVRNGTSLEAEMIAMRVEHEALRAVRDAAEVAKWNARLGPHSLADLSPTIVRNICAGTCFWTCVRASELLQGDALAVKLRSIGLQKSNQGEAKKKRILHYIEVATVLRDCVVTATSHQDTKGVLEGVNSRLALLNEEMSG